VSADYPGLYCQIPNFTLLVSLLTRGEMLDPIPTFVKPVKSVCGISAV